MTLQTILEEFGKSIEGITGKEYLEYREAIAQAVKKIEELIPEDMEVDKDLAGWSHEGGRIEGWNACIAEIRRRMG